MVDAAVTNPEGSAAQLLTLLYEVPGHLPVVHIVNISLKRVRASSYDIILTF